ncbi:hypothetical protein T552_01750 [Pneumocystis carinii B80]|uniref:Uncharacterized protein n=1 Tax=Pneumocystis carinii (strain B80) TaxID=1408658 RepID=A0A0W4ZJE7_PNEC8|nr:hypothetical protein T552_01750 [Pneumocystis carinii B80]KTW28490.1 hypothetical protein T552_01750 [Pneumocystis carinii B80]
MEDSYLRFLEKNTVFSKPYRSLSPRFSSDKLPDELFLSVKCRLEQYYYSSESDEPFNIVFYKSDEKKCNKALLSEKLKVPEDEIVEETVEEWDSSGDYIDVIEIVKEMSKTDEINVYKWKRMTSEYIWILGWKNGEGLIGVYTIGIFS